MDVRRRIRGAAKLQAIVMLRSTKTFKNEAGGGSNDNKEMAGKKRAGHFLGTQIVYTTPFILASGNCQWPALRSDMGGQGQCYGVKRVYWGLQVCIEKPA